MLKKLQDLSTWYKEPTHWKRSWCWESKRRRGRQRMRWLDSITVLMDINLSKLQEIVKDNEAWGVALHIRLWNPMDCSLLSVSIHGILHTRIPEQAIMSFSRGTSQPKDRTWVFFVSCFSRQVLYHKHHLGSPILKSVVSIISYSHNF